MKRMSSSRLSPTTDGSTLAFHYNAHLARHNGVASCARGRGKPKAIYEGVCAFTGRRDTQNAYVVPLAIGPTWHHQFWLKCNGFLPWNEDKTAKAKKGFTNTFPMHQPMHCRMLDPEYGKVLVYLTFEALVALACDLEDLLDMYAAKDHTDHSFQDLKGTDLMEAINKQKIKENTDNENRYLNFVHEEEEIRLNAADYELRFLPDPGEFDTQYDFLLNGFVTLCVVDREEENFEIQYYEEDPSEDVNPVKLKEQNRGTPMPTRKLLVDPIHVILMTLATIRYRATQADPKVEVTDPAFLRRLAIGEYILYLVHSPYAAYLRSPLMLAKRAKLDLPNLKRESHPDPNPTRRFSKSVTELYKKSKVIHAEVDGQQKKKRRIEVDLGDEVVYSKYKDSLINEVQEQYIEKRDDVWYQVCVEYDLLRQEMGDDGAAEHVLDLSFESALYVKYKNSFQQVDEEESQALDQWVERMEFADVDRQNKFRFRDHLPTEEEMSAAYPALYGPPLVSPSCSPSSQS
jgi:hypothetical protein